MLYSHCTQNCTFLYIFEAKNPWFMTKNCSKSSYICVSILSKKQHNWFYKNLHNSRMVYRKKLPDPSWNCIFNALSIGAQYTLSFQWTNFGLKCLFLKSRYFVMGGPIDMTVGGVSELFRKYSLSELSRKYSWSYVNLNVKSSQNSTALKNRRTVLESSI